MDTRTTQRLKLIALSLEDLKLGLDSVHVLSEKLGVPLVDKLMDGVVRRAVTMKIAKMENMPLKVHHWFTYWLICKRDENIGIGFVGYKGVPDAQGVVEIGYGIDQAYRRKGYMTEAVEALVLWAFIHSECQAIIAPGVLRSNIGSQRVLANIGFTIISSGPDTLDYRLERNNKLRGNPDHL